MRGDTIAAKIKEEDGGRWKDGHFSSGITGFGVGYYGSDEVQDGETLGRWHGFGANVSATHRALVGALFNLTASADANLGFGDGVEANGGIGPILSLGFPTWLRLWGG